MKKNLRIKYLLLLVGIFVLISCSNQVARDEQYTCPMHPTVLSNKPGACPVCGMNLVLKAKKGQEMKIDGPLAAVIQSPNEAVISDIKLIRGEYKARAVSPLLEGMVTYDSRQLYSIIARTSGRLENVSVRFPYQQIRKGEVVASIYSPELVTAQRELVFLLEHDATNTELISAAKRRLQWLGFSQAQLDTLEKNRTITNTVTIVSPYDGYVVSEDVTKFRTATESTVKSDDPMAVNSNANPTTVRDQNAFIRPGTYLDKGAVLFYVVDASQLRVELNVPAKDGLNVKAGDHVKLMLDKEVDGTIEIAQPFYDEGELYSKVRVIVYEKLLPGQLIKARLILSDREALWVPRAAVLDLGNRTIVFKKMNGVLRPQQVDVGERDGNIVQIKTGVASSEEIASNAQMLVDSESFVKVK